MEKGIPSEDRIQALNSDVDVHLKIVCSLSDHGLTFGLVVRAEAHTD